jgi:hypothetical protein
MRLAKMWGLVP